MNELKHALERPFPVSRISWRVGSTNAKKLGCKPWEATKGIALAYIDARDVMMRLDEAVGFENWQCRYTHADKIVICEISIRPWQEVKGADGKVQKVEWLDWITRANGAGETDVEGEKGSCSDAFKRAAVLWGIGRYLYSLPNVWVDLENGRIKRPPELPAWATPEGYDRIMKEREAA